VWDDRGLRLELSRFRRRAAGALLAALVLGSAFAPSAGAGNGGLEAGGAPGATAAAYAVGLRTFTFTDASRKLRLPGGASASRKLVTYVRYPALAAGGEGAAPAPGPFPLIVFAHGFDVGPGTYTHLLRTWAAAGYVVAAPVFPLTNARAPGGADESDVVNQPADVSFVITQLLEAGATPGPLQGLIDPARVAVAGHSDGAETALAVAYARRFRDPRVRAAVVLSGAEMSGIGGYAFAPGGPALLAVQGTRDTFNAPRYTYAYFRAAMRPKYLLRLLGAGHLPPYTTEAARLAVVERVTLAFLDAYLKGSASALATIVPDGSIPGREALAAEP
jgi:predicted dienelactone hydrolase